LNQAGASTRRVVSAFAAEFDGLSVRYLLVKPTAFERAR
jgi:hypothetical protein